MPTPEQQRDVAEEMYDALLKEVGKLRRVGARLLEAFDGRTRGGRIGLEEEIYREAKSAFVRDND